MIDRPGADRPVGSPSREPRLVASEATIHGPKEFIVCPTSRAPNAACGVAKRTCHPSFMEAFGIERALLVRDPDRILSSSSVWFS